MSISAPFIRRPVATTLLTAAIALAGTIAFRLLPVSPLPTSRLPDNSGELRFAGRKSGNHGDFGGDPARAPIQPHCCSH